MFSSKTWGVPRLTQKQEAEGESLTASYKEYSQRGHEVRFAQ